MNLDRIRAKKLRSNKDYKEAEKIYSMLWEDSKNKVVDVWLAWEYADTLKKVGNIDGAIGLCKIAYKKDATFKYNKDLLAWCLYEKYFKSIKNEERPKNIVQIIKIADFLTRITGQEPNVPYERTIWKVIKLYKKASNSTQMNKWLDKLNVNLLNDEPYCIFVNRRNIELASKKEEWYYLKCKALNNLKNYKECISLCDASFVNIKNFHNDRDIWIQVYKAQCMVAIGKRDEAITLLKKLLLRKEHWLFYKEIFNIEVELKKYDDALLDAYSAALMRESPKMKINLYFEIGQVLELRGENKYALMHYLLSKKIREDEGWKVPSELHACIDKLFSKENINMNYLYSDLKKYWLSEKLRLTVRYDGKISKLLANGKTGFIKSSSGSYYFRASSIIGSNKLVEGMEVKFSIIDSFNKKKNVEAKEAVDIILN